MQRLPPNLFIRSSRWVITALNIQLMMTGKVCTHNCNMISRYTRAVGRRLIICHETRSRTRLRCDVCVLIKVHQYKSTVLTHCTTVLPSEVHWLEARTDKQVPSSGKVTIGMEQAGKQAVRRVCDDAMGPDRGW